ncbi:acyl dehydratase [Rhodococcus fascians]|uniref:MaoC family dehydratase n=1 Tax=Nocardiaceae TaxID=85025 RepID=UPI0028666DE3|nr:MULTISPECIES: MaoC family dehydratase [Rhodococcus]MDR6909329.1 acyl dehydratase [Rhodococcus sp. 3258]MDR6929854.1 acyl dehydratase [Rhodococcus fascians]
MRTFDSVDSLDAAVGQDLGTTGWITVHQRTIDKFADATGDHQWIHTDPERARSGPFGTTVAHGYLTLSILARLLPELFEVHGISMAVNYGLNKVRFPAPVPSGARIRATASVAAVEPAANNAVQLTLTATIEIAETAKPACVAEAVIQLYR